jgi:acetyl esterase/lipase
VSLELFLRRPESFAAFGCVQGAFGVKLGEVFAQRIRAAFAKVGPRFVRVATSRDDPFRPASQRLADRLTQQGANVTFSLTPGPHSQLWLREVGSLELLHYYDRVLKPAVVKPASLSAETH